VNARESLAAEGAGAQRMVDDLRAELAGIIAEQEAKPPDDEHDVEGSSVGYERARVMALLADAEARLAEVDAAVERVGSPGYGRCEACGGPIGDDRLRALPTTRRCLSCASMSSSPGLGRRGLRSSPRVG
jgi:RNA polymerase-binding transcription factor DksA